MILVRSNLWNITTKNYTGNVRVVVGCSLLENPNWLGTNECEYADDSITEIKRILGIQEKFICSRANKSSKCSKRCIERTKTI